MDPAIIAAIIGAIATIVGAVIAALVYWYRVPGHDVTLDSSRHSITETGGTVIQAERREGIQIGEAAREEKILQKPTEISYIILREEMEMDKVLGSQLFLETPEGKIGRNWDGIKETVYHEEYEFGEMIEGDILIIHGDIGIGKTTYLFFFVADCLKKGEHVIFVDPTYLENNLKVLRGETGQIIAIDAFERVEGNFKERCSELIDFAKSSRAKIILTMRSHKREEVKNVAARKHYEVKEAMPKPQSHHIPYIVANYLLFFDVNADGLNAEDAHRIIYGNEYERYSGLREAIEIIKEKSNASPFYIFHTIKELKRKELPFEVSTIKDLPTGVGELLLNTLKTDFLCGGMEDDVFIAILICMSGLEKDFSVWLVDAICEELIELFSVESGENIKEREVIKKVDRFMNHFMVRTTNFEVLLPVYWREAIEKALKGRIDDALSIRFLRVKRRIRVRNIIENAFKKGLEKSWVDEGYFHLIADAAKQGFLDYAYEKFKESGLKETEAMKEDKDYAMFVLLNELLIRGNNYIKTKKNEGYKKAIENYNKAIEINQKFIDAYINRAVAKNKLEMYKDATKDLEEVIKLNPDNTHALNSLGVNYARIGNYDEAFSCYKKAIELNSEDPLPYYNRAILYEETEEYGKAKKDYKEAIKLKPDFVEAYYKLAGLLEKMKEYEEAKIYYKKMIEVKIGSEADGDDENETRRGNSHTRPGDRGV